MKILSVNAGSSSLKFRLFDMPEEKVLISGLFERIGDKNSDYVIKQNGEKTTVEFYMPDHKVAFEKLVEELLERNVVSDLSEIKGVGHRIVQGGSYFDKSVEATDEVVDKITELAVLAPLHNKAAVVGINAAKAVIPDAKHVVVFDTAFHQTIPEENYIYPVPYEWYTKYNVRKYGAHGTSHKYVALKCAELLGRSNAKIITCHIGSGASISAVDSGVCVDTSMGLTPNAGIMMGTRCGDIDASIIPYVMKVGNLTPDDIDYAINKKSGLLGVSGVSDDSRDIEAGITKGNDRCMLAQKIYVRKITDFIAKYYVLLGGCDAIVFTAGVGENSVATRREIMDNLAVLGVKPSDERNNVRGEIALITEDDSSIPCYVIPTEEELMIARDTYNNII